MVGRSGAAVITADDPRHGTLVGYNWHGCRCSFCTQTVSAIRMRTRTATVESAVLPPTDPRHGSRAFYQNHGCRCEACTKANTVYQRGYASRRAAR